MKARMEGISDVMSSMSMSAMCRYLRLESAGRGCVHMLRTCVISNRIVIGNLELER